MKNIIDDVLTAFDATARGREETSLLEKHALVLYYYARYQAYADEKDLGCLETELVRLIEQTLLDDPVPVHTLCFPIIPDLYRWGLVGIYLHDCITRLDNHLFAKAMLLLRENRVSFTGGAAGIVYYFLERLPDPEIENYLHSLAPRLLKAVSTCFSPGASLAVSLGMSNGMSGVLLVLIEACRKGISASESKEIIRQQLRRIISCQTEIDFSKSRYSIFPETVDLKSGEGRYSNALTWNSGDLNQSLLFYRAWQLFDDGHLLQMGDLVGLNTLLRKSQVDTGVTGAGFLAGASGLAGVYGHLYEVSKHNAYRDGYVYWINKTVEILAHEQATGNCRDRGLDVLHGLTGPALVLLAYLHRVKWQRCVLL
jgi:hypothetical protein